MFSRRYRYPGTTWRYSGPNLVIIRFPQVFVSVRPLTRFGRYRRLSKDYEYLTQTSETMIRVTMIHLMVRRLARMTCS
jgi:hypothetical protein